MAAGAETWLQNDYSIPVAGKTKTSAKCLTVVTTLPEQYKNASVNDDYEDSTTKTGTVIPFRRQEAYDEGSPCESGELQKNQITALGVGLPKVEWATGQEAGLSTYYQYIYSNIYSTPPLTQQVNRIKAIKLESTSDLHKNRREERLRRTLTLLLGHLSLYQRLQQGQTLILLPRTLTTNHT